MLIGKNLDLKLPTEEHAQLYADWYSDPNYLGEYNNVWPVSRHVMERGLSKPSEVSDSGMLLITSRETAEPLGSIGYFNPFTMSDFFSGFEIYYQVHPDHRGKGVATQSACILINHLFDALPVERIQATVAVGNDVSCKVLESAGMQKEGVYRNVLFLHGRYVDMHLYSIVRDDWRDEASYRERTPSF